MTLFSAFEDFVLRSLGALPATWSKLVYVAGLRTSQGSYAHWGLERTHGVEAAHKALPHAHRELFLEVLRTPLAKLLEDASRSAAEQQLETGAFLTELNARRDQLLPRDHGGGSEEHFSLVLGALSSLAPGRRSASRPDA
ncbi:MAG: hypothetical protein ACRD24_11720 [Terriglobales bacterium]